MIFSAPEMTRARYVNVIISGAIEDRELNDSSNERYFHALQKSYSWSIRKNNILRSKMTKCGFFDPKNDARATRKRHYLGHRRRYRPQRQLKLTVFSCSNCFVQVIFWEKRIFGGQKWQNVIFCQFFYFTIFDLLSFAVDPIFFLQTFKNHFSSIFGTFLAHFMQKLNLFSQYCYFFYFC